MSKITEKINRSKYKKLYDDIKKNAVVVNCITKDETVNDDGEIDGFILKGTTVHYKKDNMPEQDYLIAEERNYRSKNYKESLTEYFLKSDGLGKEFKPNYLDSCKNISSNIAPNIIPANSYMLLHIKDNKELLLNGVYIYSHATVKLYKIESIEDLLNIKKNNMYRDNLSSQEKAVYEFNIYANFEDAAKDAKKLYGASIKECNYIQLSDLQEKELNTIIETLKNKEYKEMTLEEKEKIVKYYDNIDKLTLKENIYNNPDYQLDKSPIHDEILNKLLDCGSIGYEIYAKTQNETIKNENNLKNMECNQVVLPISAISDKNKFLETYKERKNDISR